MNCDYSKYYYLENYIFDEVSKKYIKNGYLNSFDFFFLFGKPIVRNLKLQSVF